MSTTTWVAPCEVDVEQGQPVGAVELLQALLDDERLAEDAGRLGQRHRQPALQRRAVGQRGVVVGVTELVGGRLGGVDAARPVEQHQRAVADERHAERPAALAVARRGVDPALVEGPVDEPAEPGAVARRTPSGRSRRPRPRRSSDGATGSGAMRSHHGNGLPSPWPWSAALVRIQRRKSGSARDDRRLHGVERRPADGVGEQRRVERGGPAAPAVDDVGLALDRVQRRGDGDGDRRPGGPLGVVGGAADGRIGMGGQPAHGRHRQSLDAPVGERDVRRQLRRDVGLQPGPGLRAGRGQLGVEALLGLGHLVGGALGQAQQRPAVLAGRVADGGQLVGAERVHPVGEPGQQRHARGRRRRRAR